MYYMYKCLYFCLEFWRHIS